MSREPQFNKSRDYRIVSLPNNFWQLQKHSGQAGTKTLDPWVKAGNPTDLTQAQNQLKATDQPS